MVVSGVQQSDSVIQTRAICAFPILFPLRLLQSVEQTSLHHIVGPCWVTVLTRAVATQPFYFFGGG